MIPGVAAIPLSLVAPVIAFLLAIAAFKRRAWRAYRNFAMASTLSSLFSLVVVFYVLFLGRSGGILEAMGRMRLALCCGAVAMFSASVVITVLVLGSIMSGRRTDDGRGSDIVGRPMLAVFAVLLTTFLGVALTIIELKGR